MWRLAVTSRLACCVALSVILAGCDRFSLTASRGRALASNHPGAGARDAGVHAQVCLPISFAEIAASADAAVVQVRTRQQKPSRSGRRKIAGEGLGSGFIYDPTGLLLTNHHVVEDASEIRVQLKDGRDIAAHVLAADPPTDIAILKVEEQRLPSLAFGSSDSLRVGDWVLAIGNPFGLSHTVSAGIVSAKGRTAADLDGAADLSGYFDFIQTDASINPGNSGGPLLDLKGQVVGISTAIRAHSNNIGFAIPIDMVRQLIPTLVSNGKVRRAALGVRVDPIAAEDLVRLHLSSSVGALVRSVQVGSAADRAGVRVHDVILEFAGERIGSPERLRWLASMAGVGRVIDVVVLRDGKEIRLKARLSELQPYSVDGTWTGSTPAE